jgi:hypothetical protein
LSETQKPAKWTIKPGNFLLLTSDLLAGIINIINLSIGERRGIVFITIFGKGEQ